MNYCVITGAASGIGEALAKVYIAQGYCVIGIDRDQQKPWKCKNGWAITFILLLQN